MGANSPQEKKVRKFKNLASKEANFVNLFLGNLAIGYPVHQKNKVTLSHSNFLFLTTFCFISSFQTISVSLVGFLLHTVEPR